MVAGGSAPGGLDVPLHPTLKGSNPHAVIEILRPADQTNATLAGSDLVGGSIPGALPPATVLIP